MFPVKYPERIPAGVPAAMVYDFNPESIPEFARDPWAVLARVRREAPPFFFTTDFEADRGVWVVANEQLMREMLQQPDVFTTEMGVSIGPAPWPRKIIPLEVDPPHHLQYRALLGPIFSPRTIDRLEGRVREVTRQLIDRVAAAGECDFLTAFAKPLPSTILVEVMGLPPGRRAEFVEWVEELFHAPTIGERQAAGVRCMDYLREVIAERRRHPGDDDVVSVICRAQVDGRPLEDEVVEDMVMFVFQAGLDTVTAGLGHVFHFLATHPERQRELRANPGLIPNALEEILRAYPWIGTTRKVRKAATFHGVALQPGDVVRTLPYGAGRDAAVHDDPDTIDFHRANIPHFAFGGGVHRCAGSHLARRELRIAMEAWLAAVGEFRVKPGAELAYDAAGMFQLRALPLVWDR